VPQHFKDYTIDEVVIVMPAPQRTGDDKKEEVYEGPAKTRMIDLSRAGEDEKPVYIGENLTTEEEKELQALLTHYRDCFAWTYDEMKGIPPEVVVHTIPMVEGARPRHVPAYRTNPKYGALIKEELKKLLDVGFIYEIEHTDWVSPIVVVPKKNGKIRICVNLKNVNAVTQRDHFPLPFTENVLERVAGAEVYSFLDGFSGYNQVLIAEEDRHKTAFATEWGIFAYKVMPFGLCNAPATFQRVMSYAFRNQLRKFLEVFMDDLCIYSKKSEHLKCLEEIFIQCRLYGISLNPLKCQFMVTHGVILGHIVSRHGISTDMSKVECIINLAPPKKPKDVQVAMGHYNYYRRFMKDYAKVAQPIYSLLTDFT
jgi:hypothetical protein